MGRVAMVGEMGADERRSEEQIEEDLMKIPGVVDVFVETVEVMIFGIADAATLKARLKASLGKPVKILVDLPARPVGGGYQPYGDGAMQPPPPLPWYPLPAPPLAPYVGYNLPRYATPFDGSPYSFKDEYNHGCSCSIQ